MTSVVANEAFITKEERIARCKTIIMQAASYSGILRMKATQENQDLKRKYIETQAFDSLPAML